MESDVDENSEKILVHKPPSWRDAQLNNLIRELNGIKKQEETPRRVIGAAQRTEAKRTGMREFVVKRQGRSKGTQKKFIMRFGKN